MAVRVGRPVVLAKEEFEPLRRRRRRRRREEFKHSACCTPAAPAAAPLVAVLLVAPAPAPPPSPPPAMESRVHPASRWPWSVTLSVLIAALEDEEFEPPVRRAKRGATCRPFAV